MVNPANCSIYSLKSQRWRNQRIAQVSIVIDSLMRFSHTHSSGLAAAVHSGGKSHEATAGGSAVGALGAGCARHAPQPVVLVHALHHSSSAVQIGTATGNNSTALPYILCSRSRTQATRGRLWAFSHVTMALFFLLSAYLQLNDPDAALWASVFTRSEIVSLSVLLTVATVVHHRRCDFAAERVWTRSHSFAECLWLGLSLCST